MKPGLVLDAVFCRHITPDGHPERVDRYRSLLQAAEKLADMSQFERVSPTDVEPDLLGRVHSSGHLATVASTQGKPYVQLDPDTHTSPLSYEVARLAAGSAVELTRRVAGGDLNSGFALLRPPGHHAESDRAMGFCLLNNVALAAQAALEMDQIERVAVVDFDVHHGNGTQQIFYRRSDLLFVSTHQFPLYPGTGDWSETGEAAGVGYTLNLPLPAGTGDGWYAALFEDVVIPALESYSPSMILVSAGFDAHRYDPLAGMEMSEAGYVALANQLNRAARRLCKGRIVYFLEGGYHLQALTESAYAVIATLLRPEVGAEPIRSEEYESYLSKARAHHPGILKKSS